jgi:LmbE family N-acetylglucosaminyl deacetylase
VSAAGTSAPCLVAFHAHPDDEAIFTGGTIALAVASGWRVVLVVATSGEEGAVPPWLTPDLASRRRAETLASARLLGIDRVEFLGHRDSGTGRWHGAAGHGHGPRWRPTGGIPFDAVPIHRVVGQLRRILTDEQPAALTSYDRIGVYGHRDHLRVHDVAAASVVGTTCDLLEATISRQSLGRLRDVLLRRGLDPLVWPVLSSTPSGAATPAT